jgi:O-antigen/teichoic acid export membrane protein
LSSDSQGPDRTTDDAARRHIRSSSLLVAGRFISLGMNLLTQILIVRYLSKSDYGALAYGLVLVQMGSSLNIFGFHKTIHRFLPIYQERGEYRKMFGAIVLALTALVGLTMAVVALVQLSRGSLSGSLGVDSTTAALLPLVIFLLPVEALDALLVQLLAVFVGARAVFFRRHILGPGLKLAAVVAVIAMQGDVRGIAWGYLAGGVLGVSIYAALLIRAFRKLGILGDLRPGRLEIPAREVLGFCVPLLSSDVAFLVRTSLVIVLIEYFHSSTAVADFRAVVPLARLNTLVQTNFAYMFVPLAARLFSRGDLAGIRRMHGQASAWVTLLTFPIFAATVAFARPLTVLLFGERYAESAGILAVLSFGNYVYASLAFNQDTLKVLGRVRTIVMADLLATFLALVVSLVLVPRYAALGAAFAVCATIVAHSWLMQVFLRRTAGISAFDWPHVKLWIMVVAATALLWYGQRQLDLPLVAGLVVVGLVTLVLLRLGGRMLDLDYVFPELRRLPLVGRLLGMR